MKLTFDASLEYQHHAIQSVVNIFAGQSLDEIYFSLQNNNTPVVANQLHLSEETLLTNIQDIQRHNELMESESLDGMNFSVEMETGTGKTYVYLRSIYELHKTYGFKKFVIVVPSVAIREGVLKTFDITREHFKNIYDNTPVNFTVYDSKKISHLRNFATSNVIDILLINIDSFAKDQNVINQIREGGQKPIEYIQATNPIVIIDEPQNMETEKRISAIEKLQGMCTLRYSATHKKRYNLVYKLDPVKAYDLGLVKQIEVDSVQEEQAFNDAFVQVQSITPTKTKITAKLLINVNDKNGVKQKTVTVKAGDDLYKKSNEREIYASGYIVEEIDASNATISLSNGTMLEKGSSQGALTDEVMKVQIRKTIEEHLKKEKTLNKQGIKVLSLFFIDKVANYRYYDAGGNQQQGKFAQWFEEIYQEYMEKPMFKELDKFALADIHNGYFSQDKGKWKDTKGETKADNDTYSLIMKDKEKLLDINNSLRFIFSHSALREGWDNPNVFQICTLNETQSELKKRQEIGRGLRLAVDQSGQRTYDQNINRLTVIANESYKDFAKTLQQEIEDDCGVTFEGRIKNKQQRTTIQHRKGFQADPKFLEIWETLKHKTSYKVDYKTDDLIIQASQAIQQLEAIKAPAIRSTKVAITMSDTGVGTEYKGEKVDKFDDYAWKLPDILGYIQNKTELTRSTIQQILLKSNRLDDVLINPQLFLEKVTKAIKETLYSLMIDGIKYQKIHGAEYEMALFEAQELEVYLNDFSFELQNSSKTIYDNYVPLDSGVESQFAKDCETSEQIKFYFKLPNWFKIPTPVGTYNPDWALVFEDNKKIYFVAETKSTGTTDVELAKLKESEQQKIKCGKAHFEEFNDLEYKVVSSVGQLIE